MVRITGDFIPDKYSDTEAGFSSYDMIKFSLTYTNGSRLCPSNSCIVEFQGAYLSLHPISPDSPLFSGVLRVGTQDSQGGIRYGVYDTTMYLRIIETVESSGVAIHTVTGTINFGETQGIEYEIYEGTLRIGGGYVQLDVSAQGPYFLR